MKNVTLLCLLLITFNLFAQDCDPEFSYDKDKYCSNEGIITPNHDTGIDGIYSYTTLMGGILTLDSLTGAIDLSISESGIYSVQNFVSTQMCDFSTVRQIEVVNDITPPVIEIDDFSVSSSPWNCVSDFTIPDPVIVDESESQIPFTLEGPEGLQLIPPNTGSNTSDFYLVFGAPIGEYIFSFSATDPCGNTTTKELTVTVTHPIPNLGSSSTYTVELYFTNDIAKIHREDFTNSIIGCLLAKSELSRDTDACDIDGNATFNDDGHENDGSTDSTSLDYDPDDGAFVSFCIADINNIDEDGIEYGTVPFKLRYWTDNNTSGLFGDFVDLNGDGDVTDVGEFDIFYEIWNNVIVKKHPQFNTVICPPDITLSCSLDYTDESIAGKVIVPDTLNNGEYTIDYTPNLNACNEGIVTAVFTIGDIVYCNQTITITNLFPPFEFDLSMIPDITIDCGDTIPHPTSITAGACDFIGYTSELDTITDESLDSTMLIENSYTVIDWCIYDNTNGEDGLYFGTQNIHVVDTISPSPFCVSLTTLNTEDFSTTVVASSLQSGVFDACTDSEDLRYTFSSIPPSADPMFDENINSSTRIFTHGNTMIDNASDTLHLRIYIWDLANNFESCIIVVTINSQISSVQCPADITLNCDQDYTDIEITGAPNIPGVFDFYPVSYLPQLNACGVGNVIATFTKKDSIICTQTITLENPFPLFDPNQIDFPNDTMFTTCDYQLDPPEWLGGPCDFIGYTEDIDTVSVIYDSEFTLERSITVIDWCVYDETNGAEGLFFDTQLIDINCEPSSVSDKLEDDVVNLYPNPGYSLLNLTTTLDADVSIHIMDGNQVYRKNITVGTHEINTQDWTNGVYLITISTQEGSITKRWVKL